MKILKYLNIIIFSLTVLFSVNLYSEEKTIRIVSKDLDSTDMDYINIGVEALKKQGIHIKVEVVELVGGQSYKEKLPLSIMGGDRYDINERKKGFRADQGDASANYFSISFCWG